jgi:hypothetical protein
VYHEFMKHNHDKQRRPRVSEPVQVYLDPEDRERLDRLTGHLHTTKSDVLRRGLEALERQITDPAQHPALQLIGIAAGYTRRPSPDYDAVVEHDRFLADTEKTSWRSAKHDDRG